MAGSKKCPGCGAKGFRKGTFVYVSDDHGRVELKRVCPRCVKRAVALLPAQATLCACGHGFAVKCGTCVEIATVRAKKGAANVTELAEQLRKRASAYEHNCAPENTIALGIAQGLESAATFLESGRW